MSASFPSFFAQLAAALRAFSLLLIPFATSVSLQAERILVTPNMFATLAGSAGVSGAIDGGGRAAAFSQPQGLTVDATRTVYVADAANHTIRKITPAGVVSTFAGTPGQHGSVDGPTSRATFDHPAAVAFDAGGNFYVADRGNNTVRKISPDGVVTTLAGKAGQSGANDGAADLARFNSPLGLVVDGSGNLFVADSGNHTIRKITPTGEVSTVAGLAGSTGSSDGVGQNARFSSPTNLALDNAGNVLVADGANHTIRKITPAGDVSTVAGVAGTSGSTDGVGRTALFSSPSALAVDSAGNLYVADSGNHTVRRIAPTGEVTTIAGTVAHAGAADGEGSAALFNRPSGLAVSAWGDIYVADTANNTVREGYVFHSAPLVSALSCPRQSLILGQSLELSVSAIGTGPLRYQWYCAGRPISGATGAAMHHPRMTANDAGEYSVTVADDLGVEEKKFFVGLSPVVAQVESTEVRAAL